MLVQLRIRIHVYEYDDQVEHEASEPIWKGKSCLILESLGCLYLDKTSKNKCNREERRISIINTTAESHTTRLKKQGQEPHQSRGNAALRNKSTPVQKFPNCQLTKPERQRHRRPREDAGKIASSTQEPSSIIQRQEMFNTVGYP